MTASEQQSPEDWNECFMLLENDHGGEARALAEALHKATPELSRQHVAWKVLCALAEESANNAETGYYEPLEAA